MSDINDYTNQIHTGDAFDVLPELPAESVHACVTDPPYGLAFMGRDWDDFEPKEYQEWCERWAREVKRVLKPGGHLLAFSGNRTHHRLFTGVEDAGFEIRDTVTWHYGSGFPKALDVSKAIDKQKDHGPLQELRKKLEQRRKDAGVSKKEIREHFDVDSRLVTMWMGDTDDPQATSPTPEQWRDLREMLDAEDLDGEWQAWRNKVGKPSPDWFDREKIGEKKSGISTAYENNELGGETVEVDVTAPATDAAERWDGFKTGLKPATEYVVVARKPFDGATVDCVLDHGTGALNIDGTRIDTDENLNGGAYTGEGESDIYGEGLNTRGEAGEFEQPEGRYPSNVVFDETEAERLDRENGKSDSTVRDAGGKEGFGANGRDYGSNADDFGEYERGFNDSGGPSRYFYTSKASKAERTLDGAIDNAHPTVKPADLMEWLVTLVTAEGQIVLDPFTGSGTTCRAAKDLGRQFVGIEKQAKWADVARVRAGLTPDDPSTVRADGVTGLDAFTDGGAE